jgi:hypothetical protein
MIKEAEDQGGVDDTRAIPNGYSPGGAAAELGVTRAAVHRAIERGYLDAMRMQVPGGQYWFITQEALDAYKAKPHRRKVAATLGLERRA